VRYGNPRSLKAYYDGRPAGFPPEVTDELPAAGKVAETLVLNLRLRAGCDEAAFAARYGAEALDRFTPALAPHVEAGRVERRAGRLRLTRAGLLVANSVWGDVYGAA
jgi:oxygen-independent coproporphyrinogen-3 oxidase